MARPQKNNVDYFPFICKEGETTKYVENTYGNDGFAAWVKILRTLALTNYHYLDLSNRKKMLTLCATCKVSEDLLFKLLNDLAEFKEIDSELWRENRIVWSEQFIKSIEDAYSKRSNKIMYKDGLLNLLTGLGILKLSKSNLQGVIKPQSKVEYNKLKKSKEEETTANAPDDFKNVWNEWVSYRQEINKKLSPSTARKQIDFLRARAPDAIAIINQSIKNGWTGLFELKNNDNGNRNGNKKNVRRADSTISEPDSYGEF